MKILQFLLNRKHIVDNLLEYGKRNSQGHFRHDKFTLRKWFNKFPSIILEISIICCYCSPEILKFPPRLFWKKISTGVALS